MKSIFPILAFFLICPMDSSGALKPSDWCSGEYLRKAMNRCGIIHGATMADYNGYRKLEPARNFDMKCYRACIFVSCKAFNADGSFVANAPETAAFVFTRKSPHIWSQTKDVAKFCIKTLPEITFEHPHRSYNVCEYTEDFLQCLRANLPPGSSLEGLF